MRNATVTFLAQMLLVCLVAQLNHALAGAHVYLFVGGLLITYSALTLPCHAGLAASFLVGCACDAAAPIPFGTLALLFATAHTIVFHLRDRLPREDTTGRVIIALLANLGLFLVLSFFLIGRSPAPSAAWTRLFADLVASQVFLALIAPWFFALEVRALELIRPFTAWR
jgi:rod shape-determining protein MreD